MTSTAELVVRFDSLMADLLAKTNASRTTLSLDVDEGGFKANGVVAEALAPGIKSVAAETALSQRQTQIARDLGQHRRILVQNDCANADPQPPQELMQIYGTKAQMVAPVEREGKLVGWISVHYNPSTRQWAAEDVTALEAVLTATHKELDGIAASTPQPGVEAESLLAEAPIDTARLHATKKVPEPDSLGG